LEALDEGLVLLRVVHRGAGDLAIPRDDVDREQRRGAAARAKAEDDQDESGDDEHERERPLVSGDTLEILRYQCRYVHLPPSRLAGEYLVKKKDLKPNNSTSKVSP